MNIKMLPTSVALTVTTIILALTLKGVRLEAETLLVVQSQEWKLVTKSIDDLIQELATMRKEAVTMLDSAIAIGDKTSSERIRQMKVSEFVLKKVAELEVESSNMKRDFHEALLAGQQKFRDYEDEDFGYDEQKSSTTVAPTVTSAKTEPSKTTTTTVDQRTTQATALPATKSTTQAATTYRDLDDPKIGFDVEALKKLGEEIGKRLDQFCKDSAKNLADLVEGVKLVFRDPNSNSSSTTKPKASNQQYQSLYEGDGIKAVSLSSTSETTTSETLRDVHQHTVKLVDNIVQNYSTSIRKTLDSLHAMIESQRTYLESPRQLSTEEVSLEQKELSKLEADVKSLGTELNQLEEKSKQFAHLLESLENARKRGGRQSPLWDNIPGRVVQLWRDFWTTVRQQSQRINKEIDRIRQDVRRTFTGRYPSNPSRPSALDARVAVSGEDDEQVRRELARNPNLRQQIENEITAFGGIFDIMREFVRRLRDNATNLIRNVASVPNDSRKPNNDNSAVTPGPEIKPTIDQLFDKTVNSQRNINGQAKPVFLPVTRVTSYGEAQYQAELQKQRSHREHEKQLHKPTN